MTNLTIISKNENMIGHRFKWKDHLNSIVDDLASTHVVRGNTDSGRLKAIWAQDTCQAETGIINT